MTVQFSIYVLIFITAVVNAMQVYPQYSFSLTSDNEVEDFRRNWELFGSAKINTVAQAEEERKQYEQQATKSGTGQDGEILFVHSCLFSVSRLGGGYGNWLSHKPSDDRLAEALKHHQPNDRFLELTAAMKSQKGAAWTKEVCYGV
jgi:hypothetical protein